MDATTAQRGHGPSLRSNLNLCTLDGIAAVPLTVLSSPGNAVIAALLTGTFALSTRTYGLITSLPFWFNFLQVVLTPMLAQRLSARALCIASAWLHVAGWLAFVAVLPFVPTGDHAATRTTFIVIFSIIALSTAINGVAWNSWMQGAVPLRLRGKFFGGRNRLLYISLLAFLFAASGVLAWFEGSLLAFHMLLAVAITMRTVSVLSQHRMHLTSDRKPASAETPWPEQIRRVWRDRTYMRYIAFSALMGFSVNLFGPFYAVFMFKELHLSAAPTKLSKRRARDAGTHLRRHAKNGRHVSGFSAEARQPRHDGVHQELRVGNACAPRSVAKAHNQRGDHADHNAKHHQDLHHGKAAADDGALYRTRETHHLPPFWPETLSIMLTSGRNSARTMVPTMPPRITTMNGSNRLSRLATATSTSSS